MMLCVIVRLLGRFGEVVVREVVSVGVGIDLAYNLRSGSKYQVLCRT